MNEVVECERFSAKIDAPTCLARQRSATLGKGCEGCEEGKKVMKKYENQKSEIKTERLPTGKLRTTGPCRECGEIKRLIGSKNPICWGCYEKGRKGLPEGPPRKKKETVRPVPEKAEFTVDLRSAPGVIEKIREKAEEEMRTPEAQMAWELKQLFGEEIR